MHNFTTSKPVYSEPTVNKTSTTPLKSVIDDRRHYSVPGLLHLRAINNIGFKKEREAGPISSPTRQKIEKMLDDNVTWPREKHLKILEDHIRSILNNGGREEIGLIDEPFKLTRASGETVEINLSRLLYNEQDDDGRTVTKQLYLYRDNDNNIIGFSRIDNQVCFDGEVSRKNFLLEDMINLTEGEQRIKGLGPIFLQVFLENAFLKGEKGVPTETHAHRITKSGGMTEAPFIFYLDNGFRAIDGDYNSQLKQIKEACDHYKIPYVRMDEAIIKNNEDPDRTKELGIPSSYYMSLSPEGREMWLKKIKANPILNETKTSINAGTFPDSGLEQ